MPFANFGNGRALAQAIVDTVREPLLVLDKDLRVVAASRSFYLTFRASRQETQGRLLYALGDGQWDIPALRTLLEKIVPEHGVMDDYEVENAFPIIGLRVMLLNARKVYYEGNNLGFNQLIFPRFLSFRLLYGLLNRDEIEVFWTSLNL